MKKKLIAMMLVLAMMLALGSIGASAETAKHERVYVVAAPDGAVLSLTDTIHLENRDSLDEITDSTMLSGVQNVNGEQSFTLNDGVLTWEAMGEDITYQGTSDKTPEVLPVVRFMLDGEEVSASELAETEGDVSVEVTYSASGEHPALAVTAVILPEKGISGFEGSAPDDEADPGSSGSLSAVCVRAFPGGIRFPSGAAGAAGNLFPAADGME